MTILPIGPQRAATWEQSITLHFPGATIEPGVLRPTAAVREHITLQVIGPYLNAHLSKDWPPIAESEGNTKGEGEVAYSSRCTIEEIAKDIVIISWMEAGETEIRFADECDPRDLVALGVSADRRGAIEHTKAKSSKKRKRNKPKRRKAK